MKRKIWAVLLLLVFSVSCGACDMGEAGESGSSNAVLSEELVVEEKAEERVEVTSTPSLVVTKSEAERLGYEPCGKCY